MLYYILYPLSDFWFGFNVFRYVTFRAVFAALSAFLLCVIFGPPLIRLLASHKVGEKTFRKHAPTLQQFHGNKAGTPTMGGILIVASILISTLLWARLDNAYVWLALAATLWLGIIGFIDDYIKLVREDVRGLRSINKFAGQVAAGLIVAVFLCLSSQKTTMLYFPFSSSSILTTLPINLLPIVKAFSSISWQIPVVR